LLLAIVLAAMMAGLTFSTDTFLTIRNAYDILTANAFLTICCAGLVVVLVAGGVDISFTAVAAVAQYAAISLTIALGGGWAMLLATAIAVGAAAGLLNAVIMRASGLKSIIVTIATLNVYFGLLMFATGGKYISAMPAWFAEGINLLEFADREETTYSINLQIIVAVAVVLVSWLLLSRTALGWQIYAVGGNPEAARRLGFRLFALDAFVFAYMGAVAAIAGIAQAQLMQQVIPSSLIGRELEVLAAVVLGGASLAGGRGSVLGTLLGVAILSVLQNGLLLLGVSSYWLQAFVGLVILAAIAATAVEFGRPRSPGSITP
jgi:simple sugar transport system permease protein